MSVKTAGGSLTSRPVELARAGVNDILPGWSRASSRSPMGSPSPRSSSLPRSTPGSLTASPRHHQRRNRPRLSRREARRPRPHYRRGHGDIGQRADGAACQARPAGRPLGAGRDHHGTFRRSDWCPAVRARARSRRRRHPLHSVSRHRRLPRRLRVLDGERRRAGATGSASRTSTRCSKPSPTISTGRSRLARKR